MKLSNHHKRLLSRLACKRNIMISLVLVVGLAPLYLLPEYFCPEDDATIQLLPFLFETKRMLSTGVPWWTWQSFLGDNFIGSYAYYTFTRPILLAVCLLPYRYIGIGLVLSVYANFLILGWLTSCYLRIMGFDRRLRLIGSLLFTLSCYMLCQLLYCMFFEPVQAFVLLLICIERFLQGRRFSLSALTLASFTVAFVNYYFMPATLIASTIYFLCRAFFCYRDRWISITLKAAGYVCLGLVMASVVLVPVMTYLSGTPRSEGNFLNYGNNWALRLLSLVAPLPADAKLWLFDIDSGFYMNTAYLGVFGILPLVLYRTRYRRSWITAVCFIFILCLATPLNGLFCLFSNPYYTRWCYALIMMLLIVALSYLRQQSGNMIPRRAVIIYSAVSFYLLVSVYCYAIVKKIISGDNHFDKEWEIYSATAILFLLNSIALLLLTRQPVLSRRWMTTCLVSIFTIATAQTLYVTYRYASITEEKSDYYETIIRLTESRVDTDTFTSRNYFEPHPNRTTLVDQDFNNHLICNRPALSTYISTINPASARLAFISAHNIAWYLDIDEFHESAAALMSVKDFHTFGDYPFEKMPPAAIRGDRYIPMGMAYDRYSLMADSLADVERAKSHDILRGMLASVLIDKADEPELARYMQPVEFRDSLPFDSLVAARRAFTCDSFKGDTHGFTATISLPDTMVIMFSTAADPGFTATIDGKPSKIYNVNMGMSASIVPAGRHTIRYEYFPPGLRTGAILSFASLLIFLGVVLFEYRYKSKEKETIGIV